MFLHIFLACPEQYSFPSFPSPPLHHESEQDLRKVLSCWDHFDYRAEWPAQRLLIGLGTPNTLVLCMFGSCTLITENLFLFCLSSESLTGRGTERPLHWQFTGQVGFHSRTFDTEFQCHRWFRKQQQLQCRAHLISLLFLNFSSQWMTGCGTNNNANCFSSKCIFLDRVMHHSTNNLLAKNIFLFHFCLASFAGSKVCTANYLHWQFAGQVVSCS